MVLLNRIDTRAGDRGRTRLASGAKVSKANTRVEAYGGVDELNAFIGLARLHTVGDAVLEPILCRVQNDLFDLGADLATPEKGAGRTDGLRIIATQVSRLEAEIDALNADLEPLTSFVLPAGGAAGVGLHLARTVCRRAERAAVALTEEEGVGPHKEALRYLNRLSDLLFVAARRAAAKGGGEVLWTPGATR
ncbi:MAG: cob(I)yrinic acid a,c-diamide adenosyltransferase [Caulobacteraceae bacterium]